MTNLVVPLTAGERIARIEKECSGVWSAYGINSWERARLQEWAGLSILTERQMAVLRQIEVKAFPSSEEGDRGD